MKYKGFYDIDQMQSYLRRCIIRLEEEPIYITEVERERNRAGNMVNRLHYLTLTGTHKTKSIAVESRRVNLNPVPLGLTNYPYNEYPMCFSVARIPSRMWKIGLSAQNMSIRPIGGNNLPPISTNDIIYHPSLRDTILGDYPSYREAIRMAEEGGQYTTVAFSRHFGAQQRKRTIALIYYKFTTRIGTCGSIRPRLKEDFTFLQEHLDGVING